MDLFFYVVIIIIVILKVIFWVFYFYSRYKRKEIQRLLTQVQSQGSDLTHCQYEEQPAMPQPAFMFSTEGRARGPYPMNLPAYAEEDPGKVEYPPPPYVPTGEEVHPIVYTEQSEETNDTQPLIDSNEDAT